MLLCARVMMRLAYWMEQLSDLKHSKAYFSSVIKKSVSSAQAKARQQWSKAQGGIITSPPMFKGAGIV